MTACIELFGNGMRSAPLSPSSPQRGEVPSECEAMRGRSTREAPSSDPSGHLLPAGEKREHAAGTFAKSDNFFVGRV
jgi:hypothetical protein